jgi:hypothetical protein
MKPLSRLFADCTARAEDIASIAAEGQCRDLPPELQLALACHLRLAIAAMGGIVDEISQRVGNAHD